MLAHRFDNARQHGPNAFSSMAQQTIDHVLANAMLKFFAGNCGGIKEGAAVFPAIEQTLFVKPVKRRHQSCISDTFFESEINIAYAHLSPPPRFIEYGTLEPAE